MHRLRAPDVGFVPYKMHNGMRRFHLVAEEVVRELKDGVSIRAWGYNGSTPGPVLAVYQGERFQVLLENRLPEPTSIHWHGLLVPNQIDGVPGIGAGPLVQPGQSYLFEFVMPQAGTFMYHAHVNSAKQEMMGLAGMLISVPPQHQEPVDRDYVLLLQEWKVKLDEQGAQGVYDIDPYSHEFNFFTINGKVFPDTSWLPARYGERVRIRLGNLSMESHPMHLHGHIFYVTATDGNKMMMPQAKNTINVAPGETYDIEFITTNPGNWLFHCHKPHHMTNHHQDQMGGMMTVVKYE